MQYSIINLNHHAMHYIPMTYCFITGHVYLFTLFTHFCPPFIIPPASENHQSVLYIHELSFYLGGGGRGIQRFLI